MSFNTNTMKECEELLPLRTMVVSVCSAARLPQETRLLLSQTAD